MRKKNYVKMYLPIIIILILLFYIFYRRICGKKGRAHVYRNSYWDWKKTFPHAFAVSENVVKQKTSHGEQVCKDFLEKTFQTRFHKMRPAFLKNPITGQELELDCYNEKLKLAVEYNGQQHYKYIPYFHKSRDSFYNQKYRDKIKRDICKDKGITLIEVPYTETHNIEEYLSRKLKENGFL